MSDLTWKELTWEDVKEWKTKQYDCDGRLIQFDDDCINWLMEEVDQLRAAVELYSRRCTVCGDVLGLLAECPTCRVSAENDQLRAEKGELYQMLKAIVDTHRAGYAWMDMTKPQALLDRVVADHDELTLWTIDQLRAEIKNKDDALWKLKMHLQSGYWQEDVSPVVLIDQVLNTKPEGR